MSDSRARRYAIYLNIDWLTFVGNCDSQSFLPGKIIAICDRVAIGPILKLFAKNKMIWPFMNVGRKCCLVRPLLTKSEQIFQYFII